MLNSKSKLDNVSVPVPSPGVPSTAMLSPICTPPGFVAWAHALPVDRGLGGTLPKSTLMSSLTHRWLWKSHKKPCSIAVSVECCHATKYVKKNVFSCFDKNKKLSYYISSAGLRGEGCLIMTLIPTLNQSPGSVRGRDKKRGFFKQFSSSLF